MLPILKYAGGKRKELENFRHLIPSDFDTYIEPFCGGGAVFFDLEPKKAIINDINSRLVSFYITVARAYPRLHQELEILQRIYMEDSNNGEPNIAKRSNLYYFMRDIFNGIEKSGYLDATVYYFINKTTYSGLTRYNSKGEFNVPFGKYKRFSISSLTQEHSELLSNTKILNTDFEEVLALAKSDDFIFLDPPYDCVFSQYGNIANDFSEDEHRRLAGDFKNLSCRALLVIGKTPLTEELYANYIVDEYPIKYAVNIKNRIKGDATHIVVANY